MSRTPKDVRKWDLWQQDKEAHSAWLDAKNALKLAYRQRRRSREQIVAMLLSHYEQEMRERDAQDRKDKHAFDSALNIEQEAAQVQATLDELDRKIRAEAQTRKVEVPKVKVEDNGQRPVVVAQEEQAAINRAFFGEPKNGD
jgi:hypothetical protein